MGEDTIEIRCPLGADHRASFSCAAHTLDCATCGYALSERAARVLLRMADHLDMMVQVVEEHMESLGPAERLAAVLENEERGAVIEALS